MKRFILYLLSKKYVVAETGKTFSKARYLFWYKDEKDIIVWGMCLNSDKPDYIQLGYLYQEASGECLFAKYAGTPIKKGDLMEHLPWIKRNIRHQRKFREMLHAMYPKCEMPDGIIAIQNFSHHHFRKECHE